METQEKSLEVKFKISVYVFGVKRKCRKAERHSLDLGYIDYNDGSFDKESVSAKARDIVATNMKSILSPLSIQMLRVELQKDDFGTMMKFTMFDDRHVNFKIESSELMVALN
jgi:hypothetical protein